MKNSEIIPQTLEDFMQLYIDYEDKLIKNVDLDDKSNTVDYLQYYQYKSDPIIPFHEKYYKSQYSNKYIWMPYIFLILSFVLLCGYLVVSFLNVYQVGIVSESKLISRILFVIFENLLVLFLSIYFVKNTNKWLWKYHFSIILILLGGLFTIMIVLTSLSDPSSELLIDRFIAILGLAWAPTCLSLFIFLKYKPYITDFGGINLFFGWIFRVIETNGDIKTLNSSFNKLIYELDSWLNKTLNVIIKNKYELLEGFYLNVISNENFLKEIKANYRDSFEQVLQGLLVEKLLYSDTFDNVKEEKKSLQILNHFDTIYLNYRLAFSELPKIIELIKNLANVKFEIIYYSTLNKLKNLKTKLIPITVFILSTLIPFIISLF